MILEKLRAMHPLKAGTVAGLVAVLISSTIVSLAGWPNSTFNWSILGAIAIASGVAIDSSAHRRHLGKRAFESTAVPRGRLRQ